MAAKTQIILRTETYVDGKLVDQTAKVIEPSPDWVKRIILAVVIPWGLWLMIMSGMF